MAEQSGSRIDGPHPTQGPDPSPWRGRGEYDRKKCREWGATSGSLLIGQLRSPTVKRTFTASLGHEDDWYVAQCLEVDIASQGATEEEALVNLREAIALHFTPPIAADLPKLRQVEVEIDAG